nr:Ig-like domain-containing protein [uncultured Methanobrevibacter sp.]
MNVTIFDEWDDKFYGDANGTATVEFYIESDPTVIFRSVDVIIVDGVGYTVVHDLLPKNYTVKTTYHDDHNYNSSVNTTNYSLPQKDFAAVFVDVNAYDIMVNDTIYINVTIVPPDEKYNVPGNVTLYLDNKAYNLTLTMGAKNATATFNITNLTAGLKKVIAFYEGSKLLEPAMGEADFRVHKYNTTLSANVTNITIIQNEIINITLLNDTTGVVSAIVDGKEYFGRIKNGTVSIELPQLPVGKYNVTLFYEGDNKYHNATNYTVFYVIQAAPEIIIDVDNVTYGNETLIVVTLPEDATGNVTVKINDTYYVFDTQNLTDGKAILPGVVLPAGNYTVEVTYNGNENYTVTTNSTKFTVYKAKPVLNITVEDIYYGEKANITVTVPDGVTGNITIKINGTDKNITLPIVDGKVNWTVGGLAVGNYVIIANYSGNENYTNATVTSGVNVLQIGTVLDVDVHDVPVWDTEYINITIKDAAGNVMTNATGNVTIDINGVEYTAEIRDGVARFNTSNLTVGHKVAWVFYDGDRNLTGSRLKAEFDVTQRVPKVNVTALNITVDQDGKITINIPKNATGHVVLSGNFTDNPISVYDFTDGVAEVTVKDLAVGNYSVHIKYYGDDLDNYTVAENDTTFSVAKINATVSIVADNVTYGNATTIVVTVPEGVTGNITLKLNDTTGRNITLPIEGGKVTWVVEGLAAGNYTVNATYNGNDDYNINDTESAKFKVKKADPGLEFIVSGTVHESATVQIKINDEIHGKVVNVTVDGVPYANVSVDDEFKTQVLNEIKPYTIIVEYGGNENFTSARVEQTFTPSKVFNYGFNVTAMNITVGEDEIITVEVPDNVDDVVIWVDGQEYRNNSFTNNKATFNITGLKEGIYTVTAQVNDTDFNHYNVTTLFTVNKTYPSINITVVNETSIYVNDTVKVIVTVPKDVTKNVTIEINGMQFTNSTVNGNATFYIPQITYGNKTVVATYPGDDKYRFNSTTANFTVNKRKSQVNVTVDAGLVGDDTVINVTIPSNAVGYVIVNVDGTNYTVNTTNGNGSITIKGLGNTTHTVNVTYIGDDQYLPSENSTTFGIPKANTTIAIAVQNITYGESANITVTVENDATGYITIRIDNIRNVTLPVINGTVNWIVDNLPADNYTVYANYSGDGKYNKNETSKGFEVSQISPEIKIIEVISTADKNATIIVEIDPRVSENITVNVNNKNYTAKPVNGIAVVTTDVLDYNDYTINASYAGDKNFTKGYDIYNFITNQTDDYLINITASDINVRDNTNITVNVPADATGKVIIELNGTNYTATISGGKAVLDNVSTLKEGVYNVTAYFGSDKYVNKTVETRFAVSKVDTPIAITVINETSILVNDTVKVIVTVPSDVTKNVTIEINGMQFTNSTVNGNATFYIPEITFGNKTVVATYPGDDKYRFNSTTANFTVNKRQSQVNVTVDAGLVGDDVVINVTIPANATGYVIVSVDGTNYTVNTTNGNGSVSIKGLGNTTHTVNVTYIGDDQYLPSENSTTFGIPKDNTTISIAVESIDYGQKANITVTVKDDATGYITIKINDTHEITLPVVNGTVNWIVEDLAAGNYTVYANYSGDDKYNGNKTNKTFEVRQISPEIKIIRVISTAGENATIIVEIDPRTTENITVHVDKDYSVKPVNGIAVVTTDVLDYGNYTVNASYAGDKNFTKDYDIYKFTTNQTDDYLINITASDIEVGDNTNITVNVPSDAIGKVIIELNGTNYTVTIADGKAVLNNVSTLEEGVYNVTAYFGDDKYANKTVETRFVVSKVDTPMKITVVNDTSIYVNDTVKVVVTVPSDVTENVTIEINGMKFTNATVNGNATFYIPQITYGNKTVVATYPGDDKYRFNSTTANFTVNKRDSFINVTATDGVVDGEVIINVTVPENAIGYVVVNVNGTNYTINLTNGDDRVVVKVSEAGLYNVTVTYVGDDQFLPSNNTTSFKVDKLPSSINVTVNDNGIIANGSDVYINITAPEDITGNVTVIVWDKNRDINTTYENVYVNGGKGQLHIASPKIGNYSVTAIYLENRKYLGNENYTSFEVYDTIKELDVSPQNITYGSDETVLVLIDGNHTGNTLTIIITNASGEVIRNESVKIDRYLRNRNISLANWNLKLDAGKYNVSAVYVEVDGAKTYTYEGSNSFVVYKAASTITIKEIRNVTVGDNVTIELEVSPNAATGNISVFVNGVEYKTTTDNPTITVPNLRADNYTVDAFYHGNKNYNESNATSSFRVDKLTVPLSIDVENMGDVVQINVTVGNNATGEILLDIEDNHYYANITNGVAQFNITGLKAGKHNVTARYVENDKYYGNTTKSSVTISKYQPEFTINGTDIDFGNAELITIETKDDITSLVEVEVNGRNYTTFIKNGKGNLTLNDLAAGDYNITLYFPANDKYESATANGSFKVSQIAPDINVVVQNITYGEVETITVYVNAEGNVTIEVGGYEFIEQPLVNGLVSVDVPYLNANNYTVNVTYNGNANYTRSNAKSNFTVYKADPIITFEVEDIFYGDVEHIIVHVNAEGNVTVTVDNRTVEEISLENGKVTLKASRWNVPDYNGNATVNVEGLDAGHYPVVAIFNGNENYNKATATVDFEVYKVNTTVSVEAAPSMKIGESQVINITVNNTNATGKVIVIVDGVNNTVPVTNGTANFTIDATTAGNHTIVVIYEGDNNLNGNWTSATFEVTKLDAPINMTISNSTVGGKQTITVEVPANATGQVLIDINGQPYYANVSDGKAILEIDTLPAGEYDVVATYLGDDTYLRNSTSDKFNVTKNNSTLEITPQNITCGESETITFTVPEDAIGNITVVVNNETHTVPVSGGTGTLTIPKLPAGNYTINATYNGDGKYKPVTSSAEFEVSKANDTDIKVIDQGNGTVVVTVPDDATGNVTIKIGDENYTAPVVNGTAVITLTNATPGTHEIEVVYSGDGNYTNATKLANVTIPKYDTPIEVSVSDIKVGDKAVVEVKLPENATGNVTIEINGKEYTTDKITDGVARFEVENLTYGNKTVAVKYSGDDNYVGNFTTGNFTVDKRESFVTVDVEPANVGEDVTVKVNVPENATGWVHVTIDNQTYAIKVTDGTGTAAIKGLASGNHTVDATYLGDDQYFNSTNGTTVEVSKVPASINVTVDDITVGENAVINIETPEDLCGNVTVTVDGKNYTVPVSGGKGTLVVSDLKPDNYTVDVAFDGCKKYEPASNSTTFEVSKVNTTESSIKVIDQGNRTVVVTVPDNATGNVTIKVGNETYTGPVVNGTAVITLTNTTPGTHDIEVIYSGDENHTAATTNSTVTIPKHPTPIKVTTENINVGDTTTITVEVPEDATGNVTIEIDGKKYTAEIKDGKATFNIENLTAGNKTVAVEYVGDNNYTGNHTTGNFTVSKVAPEITVKATNSTVGDKVVIEVTAPSDVTRPVLVDVGGKGYYVNITDGKGTLEIDDLTSGNYTVTAKYLGDDKYTPANATGNFKVDKVPSTVSVEVDDITVGDKAVITVKVPKDATGNVTVTVDGKDYNVSVADGKGTLVIPGLKAGNYTVDAKYNGDDKYESSSNSTEFEVSKKDIDDMKVIDQGNGTVVVVVGDNATGNVTIKVGNNTYTVPVENGTAVVDLSNETPGKHDIEVIYSGDDTHEGQTTDATVTIPKLDTPISVDVKDSKVGDTSVITVNVPDDATGNVTIEIDGKEYTAEIKDGKAVFEVPGLTAGNKTVAVDYVGDDNYTGNHTTAKFTVSKVPSTVSATVEDSKVGENVTVKVTVPEDATGQVLVDINGVGYYVNVTNGTGSVEIPRVPSGKYDVNVTYLGDDKYLPSSNTTSFNVDKLPSYVIPTARDIAVGDTEKITFELPEDATGTLTVIIDGEEFTVDLDTLGAIDADGNKFTVAVSDGKAVLTINDLPKGEYTVEVRYNGDDKYLPSTNSTKFTVSKTSTDMEITDNGDGTVKVDLPDDATGNVTIKVGNNTYTVPVVNGTAIVNLTNETPGKHDIEVIYSGDDKYGSQDKNSTVTIPKIDTPISVEVEDINVGDTAKITVNVPEDATGTVTIEINGKEYTAEIKDGKAVFEVPDLTAGDKTVAVKYAGDKNYVGNFTTGNFTVSKVPSTASATSKDIKVGKDEVITVTVPKDATGRVLVDINGVGYYADIVNGKAKVIIPELPSGKYTAKVTYEGDDKYLPSTTTTKFTVTKVSAPISATGDKIEQGEDATVVVNLPSDATGTVTITVDGKKYTAEVKDGKAVFVIPGLTPGDHDVTAVYSGDKKYDANDTITDIDVVYPDNPNPVPEPEHGGQNGGIDLAQHSTGNPIMVLLMILMVIGSTQLRRLRKK